jgi:hypothetical protein
MVGERRTLYTPACLNCGWIGSDGTMPEAEGEGAMHERGERRPWQMAPGQEPGWEASRDRPVPSLPTNTCGPTTLRPAGLTAKVPSTSSSSSSSSEGTSS